MSIEPETRLKNLKIGNPYLKLVYQSQELSNGYAVEALIHKKISSHKISNEWFTGIGKNEIVHIVDEIVSSKGNTKNKNIDKNTNVNPTIIYLTSNGKHISIEEYANQIRKRNQRHANRKRRDREICLFFERVLCSQCFHGSDIDVNI